MSLYTLLLLTGHATQRNETAYRKKYAKSLSDYFLALYFLRLKSMYKNSIKTKERMKSN